jgi:hypothetical protein
MNDKIFHLIMIVVAGVIIADFVAHAAGTRHTREWVWNPLRYWHATDERGKHQNDSSSTR